MKTTKSDKRIRRKARIRAKITGTAARPRLVVFKSNTSTYAQLINDETGKTIASVSDLKSKEKSTKTDKAKNLGVEIAKKALDSKVTAVVFDRNGYRYHGRVKALAEGAREGGLTF